MQRFLSFFHLYMVRKETDLNIFALSRTIKKERLTINLFIS
jgi:hypothetical protein